MESSIAVFLWRQAARELLPTKNIWRPIASVPARARGRARESRGAPLGKCVANGGPRHGHRLAQLELCILAEGAMTLPVTLSGGVLFAS